MSDPKVVEAVLQVLREHGTDLLMPEDEFDCCAEEVAALFEQAGWWQPGRERYGIMPREPFWPASMTPNEHWLRPVVPVYRVKGLEWDVELFFWGEGSRD